VIVCFSQVLQAHAPPAWWDATKSRDPSGLAGGILSGALQREERGMVFLDYFMKLPYDSLPGPHVVRMFPADELFKHFRVVDSAGDLVEVVRPLTNPRIRVWGRFTQDRTLVIQLVESIPRPTTPLAIALRPGSLPVTMYLREGMYVIPGIGDCLHCEFSGTPVEVRTWHRLNEETTWRVVFRRSPGRPRGTTDYSRQELVVAMKKTIREMIEHDRHKRITKTAVAKAIGTSYRQLQCWLMTYSIDFDDICSSAIDPRK